MAEIKDLIEMFRADEEDRNKAKEERRQQEKQEDEERRRKEKQEEEERRRLENQEPERRYQQEEERRHKEQQTILQALEIKRSELQAYINEQLQMVDDKLEKVDYKVEKVDHKVDEVQTEFGNKLGQMEAQFVQEIATLRKEIMSVCEESRNLVEVSPIENCPKVRPDATMNCKVPKFDGETSWELYRKQFEAAAVADGWTEQSAFLGIKTEPVSGLVLRRLCSCYFQLN